MKRFEFRKGTSDKFWEVEVRGNILTVRFGRIGTQGHVKKKSFSSAPNALAEEQRLIQEKTRKGYIPCVASTSAETARRPSTAIVAVQVGEHTTEVAESVATWLTECLQKKMTPSHFKKIWERHFEGEDGEGEDDTTPVGEVPGKTPDGEHCWEDELENSYEITALYHKAVRNEADKFITFDDNAFVSIVALRGDPGAAEIEKCVVGADDVRVAVTAGGGSAKWPPELGPGTPIQSLWLGASPVCIVTLRDGTEVTIKEDYLKGTNKVLAKVFVGKKKVREYEYEDEPDEKSKDSDT